MFVLDGVHVERCTRETKRGTLGTALNSVFIKPKQAYIGGQRTKSLKSFILLNLKLLLNRIRRLKNSAQMSDKTPNKGGTQTEQYQQDTRSRHFFHGQKSPSDYSH